MADQFAVTFDGHLYELPGSCPLLLARDVSADPSFTLLLNSDAHNFLIIGMNNSTISIQHNGQVRVHTGGRLATTELRTKRRNSALPPIVPAKIKETVCLLGEGQLQQHCNAHVSQQRRSGCQSQIKHCAGVQSEWSGVVMRPVE